MAFSTKRGRPPRQIAEKRDRGTPELQRKHAASITTEAIDRLLQRGAISNEQHWCALHFRWLFTLRYGAPSVKSLDPAHIKGRITRKEHAEWQEEREAEWHTGVAALQRYRCLEAVRNCVLYDQYPHCNLLALRHGLEILENLWCHQNTTPS